jgi:hypothetical protein
MAGAGASRWAWTIVALVATVALAAATGVASGQTSAEITALGIDPARGVDRYQVVIGPGGSFWEVGVNHLPMTALEQGDAKAVERIEQAWRAAHGDSAQTEVQPGDSFVIEVPAGTFVSRSYRREGDRLVYESFTGDILTTYPQDEAIAYRLQRAATPGQAEVLVNASQASPEEEAKRIYEVDPPDFLQVRAVRGALQERSATLTVDLNRKYLDEFRLYRDRAARVEDGPDGLKTYWFDAAHSDIPFVRVDDAVGDLTDPGQFPRLFRMAYYRDGTVRKYVITETGDSINALGRPDSAEWTKILPSWKDWLPGQAEALPPFTPALSGAGSLLPGRIMVVAFRPQAVQASPQPGRNGRPTSGIECLGVPFGMLLAAGATLAFKRPVPS